MDNLAKLKELVELGKKAKQGEWEQLFQWECEHCSNMEVWVKDKSSEEYSGEDDDFVAAAANAREAIEWAVTRIEELEAVQHFADGIKIDTVDVNKLEQENERLRTDKAWLECALKSRGEERDKLKAALEEIVTYEETEVGFNGCTTYDPECDRVAMKDIATAALGGEE